MNKSRVITVGSAAAVLALTAGTASAATTMITSHDIQDGAVHKADLAGGVNHDLKKAELPATAGAVYRVAHYATAGNAAIASVACADDDTKSQQYVAVSGGVQIVDADGDSTFSNDLNRNVSDSFPGRMDYSNFTPKPGRLDGWVIRFGAEQVATPVNVWAVCMPRASDVKVQTNNY
jgi:hypothetical protein